MRKQRRKKAPVINDHLCELFMNAITAQEASRTRDLTAAEAERCGLTIYAFEKAVGVFPWEHSPLDPYAEGHWLELRKALLAACGMQADGRLARPTRRARQGVGGRS
jgi:hypothetical protein